MYDITIIGLGPAGVSAALYLHRFNFKVLLVGSKESNLTYAKAIDNYYGVKSITGKELFEIGISQAVDLGVDVKFEEVLSIENIGHFEVKTANNLYQSKTVFLATGAPKSKLAGVNYKKYEGNGLGYCAICDGFFYRGKKLAVIGNMNYMASEVEVLSRFTSDITIFTNGKQLETDVNYPVVEDKIVEFLGEEYLIGIKTDENSFDFDGVFVAMGQASSFDFAKHLGVLLDEKNRIIVNDDFMTNISGCFAGGDNIGEPMQVAKAVYDGMQVAFSIKKYIIK